MNKASLLKGLGYLISTVSVVLLGIVSWKSASENPLLLACLLGGMATSVAGMSVRFLSHRIDERDKERIKAKAEALSSSVRRVA